MSRIQAKAGDSLADVYDVVGSIAGIDELVSKEVHPFHEMGATIFSERLSAAIRRTVTGDIAQSATFDIVLTDLPAGVTRILDVMVVNTETTTVARLDNMNVSARDPTSGREMILWAWDGAISNERIVENGQTPASHEILERDGTISSLNLTMMVGEGQPQRVNEIAIRGLTTAFGAGTIELIALIHILFSEVEGLSSRGLPIPSW